MVGRPQDKRFGRDDPPTPYEAAEGIWAERQGLALAHARNWRLAFFASTAVTLMCVVGLIIQSTKASVVPYIVEVEAEGNVRLVGQVREQEWSLGDSARKLELERWIRSLRALSLDRNVQRDRLVYVRNHSSQAGNMQLDALLEQDDPLADFGRIQRTVHVTSQTRLPGEADAWRVEWVERTFGTRGEPMGERAYVGEFHIELRAPENDEQLTINPLGFYVTFLDYDINRLKNEPR
jgi:type IV secretion system protein VirB5